MMVALTARVSVGLSLTLTATAMGTMALASHQVVESLYWLFCPFGEAVSLCMQAYLPKMLMASRTPSLAARLQRTASGAEGMLIARRKLRFLAATHVANAAALFAA